MTDYLVDNSVWARAIVSDQGMVARLRRIERATADLFVTCHPQVLEFCHSARSPEEHARYRERISLGSHSSAYRTRCWSSIFKAPCGMRAWFVRLGRSTFSSRGTPW